jgi:hypothetical protein
MPLINRHASRARRIEAERQPTPPGAVHVRPKRPGA